MSIETSWCLAPISSENQQCLVEQASDHHYFIGTSILLRFFHKGHGEIFAPSADAGPSTFQLIGKQTARSNQGLLSFETVIAICGRDIQFCTVGRIFVVAD